MDPRWHPALPPSPIVPDDPEAAMLFTAGWTASVAEGRVCSPGGDSALVAPGTWLALRDLPRCVAPRVCMQQRR